MLFWDVSAIKLENLLCNRSVQCDIFHDYREYYRLWHLELIMGFDGHIATLVAQTVKCLPTMRETWVRFLGREDPLEKEMAIHSSTLAWKIPWTEEPDRLQSMGSQRVGHDWVTSLWWAQICETVAWGWSFYVMYCFYEIYFLMWPVDSCTQEGKSKYKTKTYWDNKNAWVFIDTETLKTNNFLVKVST